MLRVDVEKQLGEFSLSASLTSEGRVTGLFGASGAGKTSLINMIAGLLRPDRGVIALDGETLDDTSKGIHVPPHRRRIGYVFQDARLFPHLSVSGNLHYAWRAKGQASQAGEAARIVAMLGIGDLLERRPLSLSGGEKQRVAIGRALLARPRLLLLDEPLASIDPSRKAEILHYIERVRDELRLPILYVTHAEAEAGRLAQAVVHVVSEDVEEGIR